MKTCPCCIKSEMALGDVDESKSSAADVVMLLIWLTGSMSTVLSLLGYTFFPMRKPIGPDRDPLGDNDTYIHLLA